MGLELPSLSSQAVLWAVGPVAIGRLTDALGGTAGSGGRSSLDLLVGLAFAEPEPVPSPGIASTLMNFLT